MQNTENIAQEYDMACLGPVSRDYNIEPDGSCQVEIGGAVVYAPFSARAAGANCLAVVKGGKDNQQVQERFKDLGDKVYFAPSKEMTSIENCYLDATHEERISSLKSQADAFALSDLEGVSAEVWHLAGLTYGDFSSDFILALAERGDLALDVQCMLRHGVSGEGAMEYKDWEMKRSVLPKIKYLKLDAKEAKVMTGLTDRHAAINTLASWGPREVFISYHNQMLVFDGQRYYECDYQPISLAGRTGRGDTVFASYLAYRRRYDISTSLLYATALVVLKMQKTGPFLGTSEQVKAYAKANLQVNLVRAER